MVLDDNWYTEASHDLGLGFSLRIKSKLHEEQSEYQTIAVYETETFGRLLTIDGLVLCSIALASLRCRGLIAQDRRPKCRSRH